MDWKCPRGNSKWVVYHVWSLYSREKLFEIMRIFNFPWKNWYSIVISKLKPSRKYYARSFKLKICSFLSEITNSCSFDNRSVVNDSKTNRMIILKKSIAILLEFLINYRPQTKLREGNAFTGIYVCPRTEGTGR